MSCGKQEELTQELLFNLYGADELRRRFQAISFLIAEAGLVWDPEKQLALIEARRIAMLLDGQRDRPWAIELRCFHAELLSRTDPPLKIRTIRSYLTAAVGVSKVADIATMDRLEDVHVVRYLARHRGQAAALTSFLDYLEQKYGTRIKRPKARKAPISVLDKRLVSETRVLISRLGSTSDQRELRAITAKLVARLHGLPLERVLALRTEDVKFKDGVASLWEGENSVLLAGTVADVFRRLCAGNVGYVFPGRMFGKPMTSEGVRYHVRRKSRL